LVSRMCALRNDYSQTSLLSHQYERIIQKSLRWQNSKDPKELFL